MPFWPRLYNYTNHSSPLIHSYSFTGQYNSGLFDVQLKLCQPIAELEAPATLTCPQHLAKGNPGDLTLESWGLRWFSSVCIFMAPWLDERPLTLPA